MKIFVSHSSRNKPLVREITLCLPQHVRAWIDENEILLGDDIAFSIRNSIDATSDYLLLFVDEHAARSEWVRRELEWALQHEAHIGRLFVLPIVLDRPSWVDLVPENLQTRRYLACSDYSQRGIRHLADNLISELFARLSRDLDYAVENKKPSQAVGLLDQADEYLQEVADLVRVAVFAHRRENPMSILELYNKLRSSAALDFQGLGQFEDLLGRLRQRGLLAGVVCFGDDLYIEEEHYAWKTTMYREQKRRIAAQAVRYVSSGSVVALDAGSTTLEIAKLLGRNLKMRLLEDLHVVTNSIPAANFLLSIASELGLEDQNRTLNIYVAGGRIRCNTLAVVSDKGMTDSSGESDLASTIRNLGGADVAFVGTNGVSLARGFATHVEDESRTKGVMLSEAERRYVVTTPDKFGIEEDHTFARFEDSISIITISDHYESVVHTYQSHLAGGPSSVIIAR